ncbi:SusC/RagA family TonB-linked outer membrane protein [Longitalea luteola]|uniref:SusC/RagA family TonB-linked outer membrane protein n=1 Tax=Longitalea luteola TaxID=2812563 RepID=UPI001A9707CB|nr:TonB-dependent receptor [Longitalea luteola]
MRKFLWLLCGLLFFSSQLQAQSRTISGKITDESGNPVPNASITLKGTSLGTTSKPDGTYSLTVPDNATTIVISSVGMAAQEFALGSSSTVNAVLKSQTGSLSEVVIVAYGTQKKKDLTGVVATVKAPDIENRPFTSVDKILQGQVAGLQSVAGSGQPGANQSIIIRGMSSITASNAPLWVIDGIIVNSGEAHRLGNNSNLLSTLNPNDIESVSVLKDAAAGSLYGSRAANGVIIVTTKRGRAGKTRFRFDTELGQNDIAYVNDKYEPLNAEKYFEITREGLVNAGTQPADMNNTLTGLGYNNGVDFNWYDAVARTGKQQQYNISAEGGNDKTTFYLSGGYFVQEGTTINSKLDRTSASARFTHKATDKLTLGITINGGYVNTRGPLASGNFGNPVLAGYFMLPSRPAYNDDGTYNLTASRLGNLHNVIALTEIDKRTQKDVGLRSNAFVEYNILENLKFRTSVSGDYNTLEEDQYNNPLHGDGAPSVGRAFSYYTRYFNRLSTTTLDWSQKLSKDYDLQLNLQVGYEAQKSSGYQNSVQSQLFPSNLSMNLPAVGATPVTATATLSDYSFLSQFSSANINLEDKYILSGSFRRDGSSRFGANNKYGNFWSVGASWNVDKEAFIENISAISQLKLRASYGVNGNAGIGNYDWYKLYGYGFNYNQTPGSAPSNVGDSSLTWELNKPFNVGIDVGVLQNRIQLSVDYYVRKSEDLLLDVPLSLTSGFSKVTRNVGSMENKGLEIALHAVPVKSKDFEWAVDFNFATNKNRITSLPGGNEIVMNTFYVLREGSSIQSFYLREYAGVDPANGDPLWYVDGTHQTTTNSYSSAARAIVGSALPKSFGSLTNTFRYKGFTLDAQLYYNFGNMIQDQWGGYYMGAGFGATYNKAARIFDRWTKPGDVTDVPKYVYGGNKNFNSSSTFYLNKGDFIRLRNIQLGYTVPASIASKAKLSNAFVYVRGTNLFTWVKDDNLPFDPEQGTNSQANLNVFIPKTITIGLSLGF